uniref:protein-glutamine gamma-glutamyltransferase K-like n=1 Tax=Myxine glutinosa TaxID=7769 RepID=UPI00358E806C
MSEYREGIGRFCYTPYDLLHHKPMFFHPVPYPCRPSQQAQSEAVSVTSVKCLSRKNGVDHHTDEYEGPHDVVRRGQPFDMCLELSRPFIPDEDSVYLRLTTGKRPHVNKGTDMRLELSSSLQPRSWGVCVKESNGRDLTLTLSSPPDCVVGRYELAVGGPGNVQETGNPPATAHLYILFNPWCKDDQVYMDGEQEKKEYVLNELGFVYVGTKNNIQSRTWNFGQFEEGVLQACFELLDRAKMPTTGRNNPISVTRVVSAMINSQDDSGVLVGNWSEDYGGGTSPSAWNGSVEILRQYNETKRPVRYGQCWVFSAVVTTVMRCLGIPCRSISNFESAHDTDSSLTVDKYFDEDYKPIEDLNEDSIWNFHVWNDCWMERPDLPIGFGGWQAIDATPQETSVGMYRCGPTSLNAIKNGMVYLPYDTPFVFAEVNGDRVFWMRKENGALEQLNVERHAVGHRISTKAVGSNRRQDITEQYKHPEGSEAEWSAVNQACRHGSKAAILESTSPPDITIKVTTDEQAVLGSDFTVDVNLCNTSAEERQVNITVQLLVAYYTGVTKAECKLKQFFVKLKPKEDLSVHLPISHDEYLHLFKDLCTMTCYVTGRVVQTKQPITQHHSFRLCEPKLQIVCPQKAHMGEDMSVMIEFINFLPEMLRSVELRVEGPGLHRQRIVKLGNLLPGEKLQWREVFQPVRPGNRKLIGSLTCKQMVQVQGEAEVEVV